MVANDVIVASTYTDPKSHIRILEKAVVNPKEIVEQPDLQEPESDKTRLRDLPRIYFREWTFLLQRFQRLLLVRKANAT